jgi:hypothetical protein
LFQLEIICYSDYLLAVERGGIWVGDLTTTHMRDIAGIFLQLHAEWGLPLKSTVEWKEGAKSYYGGVRLTSSEFDAYRGMLGHIHASGNVHWDPGGFRYSKLADALDYQLVNHPVYGTGITLPPPPPPPPLDLILRGADMIIVKQADSAAYWLLSATGRRHIADLAALETLKAMGVPYKAGVEITSGMLQWFPQDTTPTTLPDGTEYPVMARIHSVWPPPN